MLHKNEKDISKIKEIFKYFRYLKKYIFIAGILIIVITLISLPIPYLYMILLDKVIIGNDFKLFKIIMPIWLGILILNPILESIKNYNVSVFDLKLDALVRKDLLENVLFFPIEYFNRHQTGYIQSRIENDINAIHNISAGKLLGIFNNIIKIIFGLVMMFKICTKLSIVVLCVLPFIIINSCFFADRVKKANKKVSETWAEQSGVLFQILSSIECIKLYCFQNKSLSKYIEKNENSIKITTSKIKLDLTSNFIRVLLTGFESFFIWGIGSILIINGELTIGKITAFIGYSSYVYAPALQLANIKLNMQSVIAAWDRISEVLHNKHEDIADLPEINIYNGRIQFENVNFKYGENEEFCIKNINLNIEQEEKILIVGDNGSGKSTLIKTLVGFYHTYDGKIMIDSQEIRNYNISSLRNQISVVSQNSYLFPGTIMDNIKMYDETINDKDVYQIAELIGLNEIIKSQTEGYFTMVEENGTNLSGGQNQMICIARALVKKNTKIIIFDEATSALDLSAENKILKNINQLCNGKTLINISHRTSFSGFEDRIIKFDKGKLIKIK